MLNVSNGFKNAIKAIRRQTKVKITVDYTNPTLDESIRIFANNQQDMSWNDQIANGIEETTYKWLTGDGSGCGDGTWHGGPVTEEQAKYNEFGWWSGVSSCLDGVFQDAEGPYLGESYLDGYIPCESFHPVLTVIFSKRPIRNLKVVGDTKRNEYPVDFVIKCYDGANIEYTETVIGNAGYRWQKDITAQNLLSIDRLSLEITKWSQGNARAKIVEFFTLIQDTYYSDKVKSLHILEEREVESGGLSVGSISANEIDLELNNADRYFDPENLNSKIRGLTKTNNRFKVELGAVLANGSIEFVPLGEFWAIDWDAPDDSLTAKVTARDRLDMLRKGTYSASQILIAPADTNYTRTSQADWNLGILDNLVSTSSGDLTLSIK